MRREWFLHFLGLLNENLFITIGKNLLFLLFSCFTVPMTLCRMHSFAQGHLSGGTPAPLKAGLSALVEGEALCSLSQVNVPNIHTRAKQPDGKPSLTRQRTEAQHLLKGTYPSSRQVVPRRFSFIQLRLGKKTQIGLQMPRGHCY